MSVPTSRSVWIDNLRTLLIVSVVNVHACVTYSHVFDWYIKEGREPGMEVKLPFLLWEAHLQAFFMGLLFLVAGYFAELSARKKSTAEFLKERLWRLGAPVLLYVFVIHPIIVRSINPWGAKFPPVDVWYLSYLRSGAFASSTGPLWFAEALLIFSLVFALVRKISGQPAMMARNKTATSARWPFILMLIAGLSAASFLVRLVQPIGTSFLNLQLGYFPQYIVAFILGIWLARHGDLSSLARTPLSRRIGWFTVIVSPLVLLGLVKAMSSYPGHGAPPFFGGMNLFAAGFAAWEQSAGVGLSLGIMAFAAIKMNQETRFTRWAADRSFAVYVLHSPILVALTTGFRGLSDNPFLMTALATVAAVGLSFLAADLVKRVPVLNRMF